MSTYYDLLQVEQVASQEVIEAKLDDQYTKWRSLVTHHDPKIVLQANQALKMLEEMRVVLLDPSKRKTYDASILSQQTGTAGLADPDMLLAGSAMSGGGMGSPRPRQKQQEESGIDRTDAWICPKCGKANVIGTQFCAKCGTRIAVECPNCRKMAELSNKFCSYCGVDKVQAFRENQTRQIKDLEDRIQMKNKELHDAETQPVQFAKGRGVGKLNGCLIYVIMSSLFGVGGMIYGATESWALFFIVPILGTVGLYFFLQEKQKQDTFEYIGNVIKPEMSNLQSEIKRIQQSKYGEDV